MILNFSNMTKKRQCRQSKSEKLLVEAAANRYLLKEV